MRVLSLVCIVALFSAPVVTRAETMPDSQTLRSLSDAAYGPLPNAYREVIEYTGTTGAGKYTTFKRGADNRELRDDGPFHTESGTNAGNHWHQNPNGHVVIDEPDPGLAKAETYTTTVARVSTPVDAYVISRLNSERHGTREYIDPVSHFIVRRERLTANGMISTTYDDFKAFGERHLPGHWHVHDETRGTDADYFTREYVAGAVTDADVAIPEMKHLLVEYPSGRDRIVLPSTFADDGHVLVRLTINGRGLDFLLDSGASSITIDPGVAQQLGLTVSKREQSSANAGRFMTGAAVVPLMTVGDLTMRDTVVSIVPLGLELSGEKAVGLLGFDFICESSITIDYEHKTVTAERFGSYAAPEGPHVIALPLRLGSQVPMTSVTINGAIAERMMIDTGAAGPFMLFDYFQRRHPETLPAVRQGVRMNGAGGEFDANRAQFDAVTIGNVKFAHFVGYLVASRSSYSGDADGVIGPDFLHFFDVHLDYPNGTIYLVPNALGQRSMH